MHPSRGCDPTVLVGEERHAGRAGAHRPCKGRQATDRISTAAEGGHRCKPQCVFLSASPSHLSSLSLSLSLSLSRHFVTPPPPLVSLFEVKSVSTLPDSSPAWLDPQRPSLREGRQPLCSSTCSRTQRNPSQTHYLTSTRCLERGRPMLQRPSRGFGLEESRRKMRVLSVRYCPWRHHQGCCSQR